MKTLDRIRKHLVPGRTYRRSDLTEISSNVDRHLQSLVSEGLLKKLSTGLYVATKTTAFGDSPPEEGSLLKAFLKDDHFVVYSLSQFNSLGLGSTQLYNTRIVFNRKRTGQMSVGGRKYTFRLWREAPKTLTREFLVIELLDWLDDLPEDRNSILKNLGPSLREMNITKLNIAAKRFGTISVQKKLKSILSTPKTQV